MSRSWLSPSRAILGSPENRYGDDEAFSGEREHEGRGALKTSVAIRAFGRRAKALDGLLTGLGGATRWLTASEPRNIAMGSRERRFVWRDECGAIRLAANQATAPGVAFHEAAPSARRT